MSKTREVISGSFGSSKDKFKRQEINFKFNSSLIKRIKKLIKRGK